MLVKTIFLFLFLSLPGVSFSENPFKAKIGNCEIEAIVEDSPQNNKFGIYINWDFRCVVETSTTGETSTLSLEPQRFPDADGDGKLDYCEFENPDLSLKQTNIALPDTDGDGLLDGQEYPVDCELWMKPTELTNPRQRDTDGDGYWDGMEVLILGTDPLNPDDTKMLIDSDRDGVPSSVDPDDGNIDADADKFGDVYELVVGSDPGDKGIKPSLGDVNNKNGTNNSDAVITFNYILKNIGAPSNLERSDVNSDGNVNNVDAVVLFQWVLGNIKTIPR